MRTLSVIRDAERNEIREKAAEETQRVIKRIQTTADVRVNALQRKLDRERKRRKDRMRAARRNLQILDAKHRRARRAANERAAQIKELKAMLRLSNEINLPMVEVICDHIREGLTLRAACRLAHASLGRVEKLMAEARSQGDRAPDFAQHVLASVEEALGQNELLWVGKAKEAMEDGVIPLGEGATFKKGDGKLAMAMLERQHSRDYSPRHVVVAEDARADDDLSDLSDEDLETRRRYEEMLDRRSRLGGGGRAVAGFLPPPNNSAAPAPIPIDAEIEDA